MDVPYRIDHATQKAVSVVPSIGRRRGRVCTICINADRPGIDQALLQGHSYAEIAANYPGVSAAALSRHHKANHILNSIVAKVDTANRVSMQDIFDKLVDVTDETITKAKQAPIQYAAQYYRASMVGLDNQKGIYVETEKLRLEREKLEQSRQSNTAEYRTLVADYFRKHHPIACECCGESIDRFLGETDEHD